MSARSDYEPKPSLTAAEFWALTDQAGECWEWRGRTHATGYGVARYRGQTIGAHRVAWIIAHGDAPIPAGGFICHHCDNPPCVRPDHLYLGDRRTNAQDARSRGRTRRRRSDAKRPADLLPEAAS